MTGRRLALVVALATGGCRTLLPQSTRPDFFMLTPLAAPAAAPPVAAPSILLGAVALPVYLDRRELVTRLDTNQLRIEDLELWAEPLRDAVSRTLEEDLGHLLGPGRVRRLPWVGGSPPETVVAVEVSRFERTAAGQVELDARWTVTQGSASRQREARLMRPIAGTTTQAAVASLSEVLGALSREIALDVQRATAEARR